MALVLLPGLTNLIEDISEEKKLPPQVVEAALREALLKGYERYRRTLYLGVGEDPFDEEYFSNFLNTAAASGSPCSIRSCWVKVSSAQLCGTEAPSGR